MKISLHDTLAAWLDTHAEALDTDTGHDHGLLPALADAGLLRAAPWRKCSCHA